MAENVLGTYTVPNQSKVQAGSDDSVCKGEGSEGLQKDFEQTLNALLSSKELIHLDYKIKLNVHGYVSLEQAKEYAKYGNSCYLTYLSRFGWGLAKEILAAKKGNDPIAVKDLVSDSEFMSAVHGFGFSIYAVNKGGSAESVFFTPMSIKYSDSSDKISYDANLPANSASADATQSAASSTSSGASISAVSYFFANQFNTAVSDGMSVLLRGARALANDEPLWNYVKKAVNSSLRSCSSDQDGNFIAWYPDYYGKYGLTTTHTIELIELQDLTITQSDKEFYSHVFCPGVDVDGSELSMLMTQGVVAIESDDEAQASSAMGESIGESNVSGDVSALLSKMIYIPPGDEWKYSPRELYRRYGARPAKTQSLPGFQRGVLRENAADNQNAERNQDSSNKDEKSGEDTPQYILPYLYALYEFMYHWANQYQAKVSVTFMPEVFPGSRIRVNLPDSDYGTGSDSGNRYIEFYVQSVSHSMSYSSGFTTTLGCICPVGNLVSGMVK